MRSLTDSLLGRPAVDEPTPRVFDRDARMAALAKAQAAVRGAAHVVLSKDVTERLSARLGRKVHGADIKALLEDLACGKVVLAVPSAPTPATTSNGHRYTVPQVARLLSRSSVWVRNRIEQGALKATPYGSPDSKRRRYFIDETEVTTLRRIEGL